MVSIHVICLSIVASGISTTRNSMCEIQPLINNCLRRSLNLTMSPSLMKPVLVMFQAISLQLPTRLDSPMPALLPLRNPPLLLKRISLSVARTLRFHALELINSSHVAASCTTVSICLLQTPNYQLVSSMYVTSPMRAIAMRCSWFTEALIALAANALKLLSNSSMTNVLKGDPESQLFLRLSLLPTTSSGRKRLGSRLVLKQNPFPKSSKIL